MIGSRTTPSPFTPPTVVGTPPIAPPRGGDIADPRIQAILASIKAGPAGTLPSPPPPVDGAMSLGDGSTGPVAEHKGFFGKFGDTLKAPGMSGALLRSAGATFQGGIGAGIAAGADYMDGRKASEAKAAQFQAEHGLKTRAIDIDQQQADQTGQHLNNQDQVGFMGAANDTAELAIKDYVARMKAAAEQAGLKIDWAKIEQSERESRRNSDTARRAQDITATTERRNQDATNWRHSTPSATPAAGIGSSYSYKVPEKPASSTGGFLGMGATPVPGAPAVTVSGKSPPPSAQSVQMLKSNPALAAQFDQQFGKGAAALYLAR